MPARMPDIVTQLHARPSSTTSTKGDATTTTVELDWNSLPPVGIAVRSLDGPLELYDLGGTLVGVTPAPAATLNGPRPVAWPGQVELEPVGAVEVPAGCSSAEAGGGLRVALCGGQAGRPRRVSPSAPTWLLEAVVAATQRFGLEVPVRQSDLAGSPVY